MQPFKCEIVLNVVITTQRLPTLLYKPASATTPHNNNNNPLYHPLREYCRWETANVTCPSAHLAVIRSAYYGRMRNNRCTETEVYVGCSYDALAELDFMCSGRPQCSVTVPVQDLHEKQPCPKDMLTHLELEYECVPDMLDMHSVRLALHNWSSSGRRESSDRTNQYLIFNKQTETNKESEMK
ncbi:hypothetical protein HELRODRAFT_175037 [Helobdella robusta]|uniref:SUEL-type lectin domain-containing protein n=1 Tax=Helobdella robusta TaxID=6412 RepID=T1F8R8_HELRO|nr:hypothetical protein HELRODRAFT_175037 [Helobdella robusta]ESO01013.1 hypothetical protein HELRODRAFT_175037 [Helobdella robusta]